MHAEETNNAEVAQHAVEWADAVFANNFAVWRAWVDHFNSGKGESRKEWRGKIGRYKEDARKEDKTKEEDLRDLFGRLAFLLCDDILVDF